MKRRDKLVAEQLFGADYKRNDFDFRKHLTPVDFNSKEVREEMEQVAEEIKSVMEGAKIDPSKMLQTFYMEVVATKFVQGLPKVGFWKTFPKHADFFKAGIIYGIIAARMADR